MYPIHLLNVYHVLRFTQVIKNPELSCVESAPEARKERKDKTLWLVGPKFLSLLILF